MYLSKSTNIFSPNYWREAANEIKNTKVLVTAALILAMNLVMHAVYVPVGENLRVYFTFAIKAVGCVIFGPVAALCYGLVSDIIGFMMYPTGPYFPGYTVSSMLGVFVYALFLYRTKITVLKIFLAKLSVNVFINIILGSVWSSILMGKGYYYYFAKSLVKNITLLPFEVVFMVIVFQVVLPIMDSNGLLKYKQSKKIPLF